METTAATTTSVVLGSASPEPEWRGTARLTSGAPLHGETVALALASAERTTLPTYVSVRPDARGGFARRVPAGRYHVMLAGVPQVSRPTFDVEIGPGGLARDVVVPGVLVEGTLVDAATGQPFPQGRPGTAESRCLRPVDEVASSPAVGFPPDARGAFRLRGVPPGRYVVDARPAAGDDRDGASADITVVPDRDVAGLALDVHAR